MKRSGWIFDRFWLGLGTNPNKIWLDILERFLFFPIIRIVGHLQLEKTTFWSYLFSIRSKPQQTLHTSDMLLWPRAQEADLVLLGQERVQDPLSPIFLPFSYLFFNFLQDSFNFWSAKRLKFWKMLLSKAWRVIKRLPSLPCHASPWVRNPQIKTLPAPLIYSD